MLDVVSEYCELQSNLSGTLQNIGTSKASFSRDEVVGLIRSIQTKVNGIGESLSVFVPTKVYNQVRQKDSTTAMTVFQIPELLELILRYNTVFEVLAMYQTCRGIRAIIEASPRIQTQLFLRPENASLGPHTTRKRHPLAHLPLARRSWFEMECLKQGGNLTIYVSFGISELVSRGKDLPTVGHLWKRMQICQPPLMSIPVPLMCWKCLPQNGGAQFQNKEFATGRPLTFGDLYDKANAIFQEADDAVCSVCGGTLAEIGGYRQWVAVFCQEFEVSEKEN